MLLLSKTVDQKSLETEFLIAICRPTGNKWQSKTLFLAIFDPRSMIDKSVFDGRLSGVVMVHVCLNFPTDQRLYHAWPYQLNKTFAHWQNMNFNALFAFKYGIRVPFKM